MNNDCSYTNENRQLEIPRNKATNYFLRLGLAILLLSALITLLQNSFVIIIQKVPALFNIFYRLDPVTNEYSAAWWLMFFLSACPNYMIAFPIYCLVLPKKPILPFGDTKHKKFGFLKFSAAIIMSIGAMAIFNIFGLGVTEAIKAISGGALGNNDALTNVIIAFPVWATLILTCICAPIFEELMFRKLLVDRVKPFGEFQACLFSAIMFGLYHGNFRQFFYATALGFILAYIYSKTNNIFYTIGLHAFVNLFGSILLPQLSNIVIKLSLQVEDLPDDNVLPIILMLIVTLVLLAILAVAVLCSVTSVILLIIFIKKKKLTFDPAVLVTNSKISKIIYANPAVIGAMVAMFTLFIVSLL